MGINIGLWIGIGNAQHSSLLKQTPDGAIMNKSETKYLVTRDSEKYITIKTV